MTASSRRARRRNSARPRARASCAATPARCCAASGRAGPAPARAMPTRTASWCAPTRSSADAAHAGRGRQARAVRRRREWDGAPLDPSRTFVTGVGAGTTYPDYKPAPFIVSAEHDGRRHRHRRDRGHLQLLRRQGEDRHRPASRPRDGAGPRRGRAGRPRDHRRIRLADALHRRRAPPDRRLQEGGHRHLRRAARSVLRQARGDAHRRRPRRGRAGRRGADRRRPAGGAHARRLRLGHRRHLRQAMARPRRRGDRGRRPHHRRADRAPGRAACSTCRRPASACAGANRRRGATSRSPIRASAGAAPTSPSRCRSSRRSTPRWPGPACAC